MIVFLFAYYLEILHENMKTPSRPSRLELQVLSVLYSSGPSTVAFVMENIPDEKERAYTTILSVLQSLERKELVEATREGRLYIYKQTKSQESIVSPLAKYFLLNAFGGSIGRAILHLLSNGALTPEETTAVEGELKQHRAMAAKKKTTKRKAAAKRKPATKAAKRKPAKKAQPACWAAKSGASTASPCAASLAATEQPAPVW